MRQHTLLLGGALGAGLGHQVTGVDAIARLDARPELGQPLQGPRGTLACLRRTAPLNVLIHDVAQEGGQAPALLPGNLDKSALLSLLE